MPSKLVFVGIFVLGVVLLASINKIAGIYIGKQKRLYVHMGQHVPSSYLDSSWYEHYIYLMIIITSVLMAFIGIWGMVH